MWTSLVVVGHPFRDCLPRVVEPEEQSLVQQFVAHAAVEGFDVPVLHGLARCDVVPIHGMVPGPGEDRVRGELGAVIGNDHARLATPADELSELTSHPLT